MFNRQIKLPATHSFILLGPRQTGKSTLILSRFHKAAWTVDLLLDENFIRYSKDPSLYRKEALEKIKSERIRTIIVDEIQKVPLLLNEIQYLMGKTGC